MRNLPRFALVPLAVLISALPLVGLLASPAVADSAADCDAAFGTAPAGELTYVTDPPQRLAWTGQTVRLSAGWDPASWDSLSSAVACVSVDDVHDDALGTSQSAPPDTGTFEHAFTIPEVAAGTRLCTRIRLAGDPAGDATDAVWVSKEHCYEVDHEVEEESTPPDTTEAPPTSSSSTTTTTVPVAAPAEATSTPGGDTPAIESPEAPASPAGSGGPVETPFDTAGTPNPGVGSPHAAPSTPEGIPLLPATGYASVSLLHKGELFFFSGLALLVLFGFPRRRRAQPGA
ncbi:MAG: hypothetical protein LC792_10850 [Actinobacteria bacterium]|nr:hypothetical protein [Actinomycetota bacterium]